MLLAVCIPNTVLLSRSLGDELVPAGQYLGSSVLSYIPAMSSHQCFSKKAESNFHLSDLCASPSISFDLGEKRGC